MVALQRFGNGFAPAPFATFLQDMLGDAERISAFPALDLEETADAFVVQCDLPGVDPKDIALSVEDEVVTLRASRNVRGRTDSYARTFRLPKGADAAKAEASYERGVLALKLPKREESKPRTIQVKVREE